MDILILIEVNEDEYGYNLLGAIDFELLDITMEKIKNSIEKRGDIKVNDYKYCPISDEIIFFLETNLTSKEYVIKAHRKTLNKL